MDIALVTGSSGLVGASSVRLFAERGFNVVGIDNDMRRYFFGDDGSTDWSRQKLENEIRSFSHRNVDIRDKGATERIFKEYGSDIKVILHCAAQPSHDWAAKEPFVDFSVNANGTLVLLEMTRLHCPEAVFIHCSTNKVYGDTPNFLPLIEHERRWEVAEEHKYYKYGIDEEMSIDQTKHSLFGVSKVAGDILAQEYGRYFGLKTGIFRGGCLTGPDHSGAQLHGFLAYLIKCAITETPYTVFGYKGKQVRDNIHAYDLVNAFYHFYKMPRSGEVYNIGGSRHANCSMLEAIELIEKISGKKLQYSYVDTNRIGDHIWWISDIRRFRSHFPDWEFKYSLEDIFIQIYEEQVKRH